MEIQMRGGRGGRPSGPAIQTDFREDVEEAVHAAGTAVRQAFDLGFSGGLQKSDFPRNITETGAVPPDDNDAEKLVISVSK